MAKISDYRGGVTDAYYAEITETPDSNGGIKIEYGTPAVLGGTASINVSHEKGENKVYESDVMIRNISHVSGANIEYQSRSVDQATEMKLIYGLEESDTGDYMFGPEDKPKPVAFGYAHSRTNGGYDAYWYLYTMPSASDESAETATENETTPTRTYNFGAIPSPENQKMARFKVCKDRAELNAFFASVLPA